MVNLRNLSLAEYESLVQRVNTVICKFYQRTDQTTEASIFVQKIDQFCNSKEDLFKTLERKLAKFESPQDIKHLIDSFIQKRPMLTQIFQKMEDRKRTEVGFLQKLTDTTMQGLSSLETLLKLNPNEISIKYYKDLLLVSKMMQSFKKDSSQFSSSTSSATSSSKDLGGTKEGEGKVKDEDFIRVKISEMNCILQKLLVCEKKEEIMKLEKELSDLLSSFRSWLAFHHSFLTTPTAKHHVRTLQHLLTSFLTVAEKSANFTPNGPTPNEKKNPFFEQRYLALTMAYAVISDLKANEDRVLGLKRKIDEVNENGENSKMMKKEKSEGLDDKLRVLADFCEFQRIEKEKSESDITKKGFVYL